MITRDKKGRLAPLSLPSVIYTFSFAHHGSYSSFHRLAHYLSDQCVVDLTWRLTWRRIDRFPPRISAALMHRWLKYGEYRLRGHLRSATPRCVHYIYPETSLQQSWRWKGHHKLVLTVHQPPEYLERMRQQGAHEGFFRGLEVADAVVAMESVIGSLSRVCAASASGSNPPWCRYRIFSTGARFWPEIDHIDSGQLAPRLRMLGESGTGVISPVARRRVRTSSRTRTPFDKPLPRWAPLHPESTFRPVFQIWNCARPMHARN